MRARPAPAALITLVGVLFALLPAAASAATLNRNGGVYTYTGTSGVNAPSITGSPGLVQISDNANITVTGNSPDTCTGEGTTSVNCTTTPTSIVIDTAGGADTGGALTLSGMAAIPVTVQTGTEDDGFNVAANFTSGTATMTMDDSGGNDNLSLNATTVSGMNSVGFGTVDGGTGDDVVSGTATVNGGDGKDVLRGIAPGLSNATLNGGNNDDTFNMNDSSPEIVNGGAGIDTLDYAASGGAATVTLDGVQNDGVNNNLVDDASNDLSIEKVKTGAQNDTITGGSLGEQFFSADGNDVLNGGGGEDVLDGQGGADTMIGGSGEDTITYESRAAAVRVSPDGIAANDGEANEFDAISGDVENILGGFANDYILGNSLNNSYNGGPGDDQLEGGDGLDTLTGGFGQDKLEGGGNNDTLNGNGGDDTLDGGADTDTLNGGGGADLIDGSAGTDTLNGENGSDKLLTKDNTADTVNCGNGTDHSVHDVAGDTINADCEISDTGAAGFDQVSREVVRETTVVTSPLAVDGDDEPAVVTCTVTRAKRAGVRVKCRVSGADGALGARLVRGSRVFARARRTGSGRLTLRAAKRTRRGRYTVVVSSGGRTVARLGVRV